MKLLVTRRDGFIGSNLILHILANFPKFEIINLDAGLKKYCKLLI
jgi:dTDP-D-glucose 4,6-dehydratase